LTPLIILHHPGIFTPSWNEKLEKRNKSACRYSLKGRKEVSHPAYLSPALNKALFEGKAWV